MIQHTALPVTSAAPTVKRSRIALRLFCTVWLIYTVHFASNIVRETYLALALAERGSVRVDEYIGLHPDLFVIEGRGAYINNNPGASMLGAIPYFVARPAVSLLLRLKPELSKPKPTAVYNDPRPNRQRFLNEARARGLDIKLGLAAVIMHVGLMGPLAALAAVAVFRFLRRQLSDERKALWLAILYAFGTPIFFRSAFLNQNVLIAHAILFAYLLATRVSAIDQDGRPPRWELRGIGALLGLSVLCDYSGVALMAAFGIWVVLRGWRVGGLRGGSNWLVQFIIGAAAPIALLLAYQWRAFGNPLLPAQVYMPATTYSVRGWNGFFWPSPELMWRNLFDLRYGLFAFSPMLILALTLPFAKRANGSPNRAELGLIFGASLALYLFICSVQFAFLQWNTGVRYMVPAVPLLFFAMVPVILSMPRWAAFIAIAPTVLISWSVSMAREDVRTSLGQLFQHGFELPLLTVLSKTASGYFGSVEGHASILALFVFMIVGAMVWLMWRLPFGKHGQLDAR